jgi:O-glycosyl hydrolase
MAYRKNSMDGKARSLSASNRLRNTLFPRTLGMALCVIAAPLLLSTPAFADSGQVSAQGGQTFRGWGMSLAWEGSVIYGGKLTSQAQGNYMDLLYGDPAVNANTLGLNIARYNIGGGDDPSHHHMTPKAQMEGFQAGPGLQFDWGRDAGQRQMLHEAKNRGANIFEAFSNSPPYWMTVSGCASGATTKGQDNLRPDMTDNFVGYLSAVVKHFKDVEGIEFDSVEPFNEPAPSNWWVANGKQEGNSASYASENAIIPKLAMQLRQDGLKTIVSGVDMNNVNSATGMATGNGRLSPSSMETLGRYNTHDYHNPGQLESRSDFRALAQRYNKPIWMSEVGCCFTQQSDIASALYMADTIRADLRDLGAEAWMFWQTDWGIIKVNAGNGVSTPQKQYYGIAQYSRFIRPGFTIVSAGAAQNTLAAYSSATKRLVLVSTNDNDAIANDLDVTAFNGLPKIAMVYRTSADASVNLQAGSVALSSGHLIDQLPPQSITTYVIDGVTPR